MNSWALNHGGETPAGLAGEVAAEYDVAVITNRPFVNGRYFPLVEGQVLPDWAGAFDCESWAQCSFKYILANPAVTCVIAETSRPPHAVEPNGRLVHPI